MRSGYRVIAIIPARGGSKGIPHKNMRTIGGVSLTARVALLASSTEWIDEIFVSTDSGGIQKEAISHGAQCPFLRPDHLSGDLVGGKETWQHAWLAMEEYTGQRFDISLYMEPTSPLRIVEDMEITIDTLIRTGADLAATVSKNPAHFTPEKTLVVNDNGRINHYLENGAAFATRQRISHNYYHRNGICYAAWRQTIAEGDGKGTVLDGDCIAIPIDRPIVNIDDPFDMEMAEWLIARQENQS